MTALEVLRGARALISDRARWTSGANARTANGRRVPFDEEDAVAWCAQGALFKVAGYGNADVRDAWIALARTAGVNTNIPSVNDNRGYAAALNLFDKAIATLETEALEEIPVADPSPELVPA